MKRAIRACLLVFFSSVLPAQTPGAITIRNARVLPVSGPALKRATIVIRGGLIEAVGENIAPPGDAYVMEAEGLTVYPGLIDALSTWGLAEPAPAAPSSGRRSSSTPQVAPPATPDAGQPQEERSPTNCHVRAADLIRPADPRIEAARGVGFTTAASFPMRGVFAGQGVLINLAGEKAAQMVVVPSLGQYVSFSNLSYGVFPSSVMGAIAHVRQVYLDAEHYRLAKERYARSPNGARRPDYDRALEGLLGSTRALLPASRAVEIDRALRLASELRGVDTVIYGLHEGYLSADRLRAAGRPVLVSLKWPERSRDADPDQVESLRTLEMREKAPSTPAALAKAGVKFAFYSDATERPRDLMRALRRALDAGLSPGDALRALTLSAAEIYGVADRLGSIERGKIANLVVTSGELFQEKTEVRCVFIDGLKYEPGAETGEEARR